MRPPPDRSVEDALAAGGASVVAGMDEVGRGAWAGPVSVGVVVMHPSPPPEGVRDSKEVPESRRGPLADAIAEWCTACAVGHASAGECDELGMTAALSLAGWRALGGLGVAVDAVILDGPLDYLARGLAAGFAEGVPVPGTVLPVVKGDQRCLSAAAASLVAKAARDAIMRSLAPGYPGFEFDRNKGYPSPTHRRALDASGLTVIHRRSWSYVDRLAVR